MQQNSVTDASQARVNSVIKECIKLIIAERPAEVRKVLRSVTQSSMDGRLLGRYLAVDGIAQGIGIKRTHGVSIPNTDTFAMLDQNQKRRLGTIWADEFDRGYWETWVDLFPKIKAHALRNQGGRDQGGEV